MAAYTGRAAHGHAARWRGGEGSRGRARARARAPMVPGGKGMTTSLPGWKQLRQRPWLTPRCRMSAIPLCVRMSHSRLELAGLSSGPSTSPRGRVVYYRFPPEHTNAPRASRVAPGPPPPAAPALTHSASPRGSPRRSPPTPLGVCGRTESSRTSRGCSSPCRAPRPNASGPETRGRASPRPTAARTATWRRRAPPRRSSRWCERPGSRRPRRA